MPARHPEDPASGDMPQKRAAWPGLTGTTMKWRSSVRKRLVAAPPLACSSCKKRSNKMRRRIWWPCAREWSLTRSR
eukprot:9824788-Alexandrium_andersonii.AAC.1